MRYKYDYNMILELIFLMNRLSVTNASHITIPMILEVDAPIDFILSPINLGPQ